MATLLRAIFPLACLPGHAGKRIDISVAGPKGYAGLRAAETFQVAVDSDGSIRVTGREESAAGSSAATINTWLGTLLDNNRGRIRVRGNHALVDDCLTQLHSQLWMQ